MTVSGEGATITGLSVGLCQFIISCWQRGSYPQRTASVPSSDSWRDRWSHCKMPYARRAITSWYIVDLELCDEMRRRVEGHTFLQFQRVTESTGLLSICRSRWAKAVGGGTAGQRQ